MLQIEQWYFQNLTKHGNKRLGTYMFLLTTHISCNCVFCKFAANYTSMARSITITFWMILWSRCTNGHLNVNPIPHQRSTIGLTWKLVRLVFAAANVASISVMSLSFYFLEFRRPETLHDHLVVMLMLVFFTVKKLRHDFYSTVNVKALWKHHSRPLFFCDKQSSRYAPLLSTTERKYPFPSTCEAFYCTPCDWWRQIQDVKTLLTKTKTLVGVA